MKKIIIPILLMTLISSCITNKVTAFVAEHCKETHYVNPFTKSAGVKVTCDSLYNVVKVKQVCPTAKIKFDAANATLEADLQCTDSTKGYIEQIIKMAQKAFGK